MCATRMVISLSSCSVIFHTLTNTLSHNCRPSQADGDSAGGTRDPGPGTILELPTELWQRVFFFASQNTVSPDDHVKLWTSVRAVSRSWRAMITREYLDAYIKDPERCLIYWELDGNWDWAPNYHFDLETTFDRFDKDTNGEDNKTRVVFRETKNTRYIPNALAQKTKSAHKRNKIRAFPEAIETYLGTKPFGNGVETAHVICIYGQANDTPLPGLRCVPKTFEISFKWEPMLIAFMKETMELQRRTSEASDQVKDFIARPDLLPSDLLAMLNPNMAKVEKARRNLRRERIQRHYRALFHIRADQRFPVDGKEEAVILKRISYLVGRGAEEQVDRIINHWGLAKGRIDGNGNEDEDDDGMHEREDDEDLGGDDANIDNDTDSHISMDEMIDLNDVETGEWGDSDDSDDDIFAGEDDENEEEDDD